MMPIFTGRTGLCIIRNYSDGFTWCIIILLIHRRGLPILFTHLEAIVEAGIFAMFLFCIPIHPLHLAIFFFVMIGYNVYGHLGYELYPKGFSRHWLGKWINTSVNHNQHHQYFRGNYGLYFLWWDRWMHTIPGDYDDKFNAVKTGYKAE